MRRLPFRRALQVVVVASAVLLLVGASDDARFNKLGHKLMCMCGCNQILLECNHVGCQYSDGMRNDLSAALQRGDNDDLTLQGFVQKFGPTVLAAPTTTGFNRVAWVMPFFVLVAGLGVTVLIVRVWNARRPAPSQAVDDSPEAARLREQARKDTEL
jgi:cytochrome c-type biogenesis protein CcmH/NrfF